MSDIDRLIEKSKLHGESGILVTPSMAESLKRERDSANARAEAAEKKVADLKQELANTQMAAGNQIDWKPNATLATAHGLSKIDYMDLLEKCADTTINRLAQENINLTEQLQSANARAEAAENDLKRIKEGVKIWDDSDDDAEFEGGTHPIVMMALDIDRLNAQIEQLQKQAVCQHYLIEPHLHSWKCSSCGCVLQDDGDWQNQYRLQQENEQLQEQLDEVILTRGHLRHRFETIKGWCRAKEILESKYVLELLEAPLPPTDLVPGGES